MEWRKNFWLLIEIYCRMIITTSTIYILQEGENPILFWSSFVIMMIWIWKPVKTLADNYLKILR